MTISKTGLWIDRGNSVVTTSEPADGEPLVFPGGEICAVSAAIVAGINGDVEPAPAADGPKPAKKDAAKKAAETEPDPVPEPTEKES